MRKSEAETEEERVARILRGARDLLSPVDVCGQSWRLVEANGLGLNEYGQTIWGETSWKESVIAIRTRHANGAPIAIWSLVDTILHELFHAMFHSSGTGAKLRRRLKMSRAQWDRFEETFIELFTPVVLATLTRAGLMVFPRLPRARRHRSA